ncbi:MAG: hypothetical protein WD737_06665 [Gemmatimonadota bacterium]
MTTRDTDEILRRVRDELVGRYFSNRSELRQMAEAAGFSFVPVEFLCRDDEKAIAALRPTGVDEMHVLATRVAQSQPYYITDVVAA